jgi:hypothetical protein
VHGVGQQFERAEVLTGRWKPALKDGMSRAKTSPALSMAMLYFFVG